MLAKQLAAVGVSASSSGRSTSPRKSMPLGHLLDQWRGTMRSGLTQK